MNHTTRHALLSAVLAVTAAWASQAPLAAQRQTQAQMDPDRAARLYVSDQHEDHPVANYERDMEGKARTDSIYRGRDRGRGGLPEDHLPEQRRRDWRSPRTCSSPWRSAGPGATPPWSGSTAASTATGAPTMWPFVREAVERGYVVICPEYRGSTGYGAGLPQRHRLRRLRGGRRHRRPTTGSPPTCPTWTPTRVGIMGWSHGGYITIMSVTREDHPFQAGAAIVPVTNLIFRLSYKGPGYQRSFSTQERIQGLPFEKREEYIERSPLLRRWTTSRRPCWSTWPPTTEDVNFEEDQHAGVQAARPEAGPHGDEDLRGSGAGGRQRAGTPSAGAWIPRRWSAWTRLPSATRGTGPGRSSRSTCGRTRILANRPEARRRGRGSSAHQPAFRPPESMTPRRKNPPGRRLLPKPCPAGLSSA